ncbi:MAG: DUF2079 domain-containing protein [Clostridiales bacterium]|nr:DUF2079 domain-containing protein [Clostridiales bacterium]
MSEENNTQAKVKPSEGLFPSFGLPRLIAVFFWFAGIDLINMRKAGISAVSDWQDFIGHVSVLTLVIRMVLVFGFLTLIRFLLRKKENPGIADSAALFTGSIFFACSALYKTDNFYLTLGVLAVCLIFAVYAAGKSDLDRFEKLSPKASTAVIAFISIALAAFICLISICRHMTYNTACFDMGIFTQMFHSMKQDLTMNTTCERDQLLSHLNIHSSFILYILLPFYALFPGAKTLLIAQGILCVSGVIPVVLIARKHGLKGLFTIFVSCIYLFNTGLISPCFFHFHENCFLPPLLMWLMYAVDSRKTIWIYILSALTLIVKEDAPLYLICIGLFLFADEKGKKRIHGAVIAVLSLVYFVVIMRILGLSGSADMMMDQRFSNLVFGGNTGFTGMVMNILKNPSYFFSLFFSEKTLLFFLQMMLPLLFLPFLTNKIHRYFLMLPFVIMNLVIGSGYRYAAEMGYHYTFGTACLLIFMVIINCSDLSETSRNTVVTAVAAAAIITSVSLLSMNITHCDEYLKNREHYERIEAALASIPEDAVVISDTNYLPHVASRKEIYLLSGEDFVTANGNVLSINDVNRYDYFVLNEKDGATPGISAILEASGYKRFAESEGCVLIYKK